MDSRKETCGCCSDAAVYLGTGTRWRRLACYQSEDYIYCLRKKELFASDKAACPEFETREP